MALSLPELTRPTEALEQMQVHQDVITKAASLRESLSRRPHTVMAAQDSFSERASIFARRASQHEFPTREICVNLAAQAIVFSRGPVQEAYVLGAIMDAPYDVVTRRDAVTQ